MKSDYDRSELTTHISELEEERNLFKNSRKFQEVEAACGGRLSHVPSSPAECLNPLGMPSVEQSMRQEERNQQGISGDVS